MNALEQEYADNVKRADRREKTRIALLVVAGLGAASGVTALAGHPAWILPGLVAAAWSIRYYTVRFAPRVVPEPIDDPDPAQSECGYRDSPVLIQPPATQTPVSMQRFAAYVAIVILLMVAGVLRLVMVPWDRLTGRLLVALMALGIIIAKCVYAAWKKRHDAKLMIEWERRLEEMK